MEFAFDDWRLLMSGGWEIREIFSLLDAELLQAVNKERQRSVCEIQICSQPQKNTNACMQFIRLLFIKTTGKPSLQMGELHIIKS
jgi:hypothetical protein